LVSLLQCLKVHPFLPDTFCGLPDLCTCPPRGKRRLFLLSDAVSDFCNKYTALCNQWLLLPLSYSLPKVTRAEKIYPSKAPASTFPLLVHTPTPNYAAKSNGGQKLPEFLYTTVPGKIAPLLAKIKDVGKPTTVSVAWLRSIGFTSSNDASLINMLRAAKLIDDAKKPTDAWGKFRGSQGPKALAAGIRESYSALYNVYGDAHARTPLEIQQVISTTSDQGQQAIAKMVASFRTLAGEADFSDTAPAAEPEEVGPMHAPVSDAPAKALPPTSRSNGSPSLHIDLQIHISPDATADQIDAIFGSMARHLYGAKA